MRGRLALLVAATTSVVLLAFLLPLAVLVQRAAHDNAVSEATRLSQDLASNVSLGDPAGVRASIGAVHGGGFLATVEAPDGSVQGDTARLRSAGAIGVAAPAVGSVRSLSSGTLIRQPVVLDDGTSVVSTLVPDSRLRRGVLRAWLVLGALGVVLVALSLVVADRLARSITRPISDLAHRAERLGAGDLTSRVEPDGPQEVREVGRALNRLAARIDELLTRERESVADLSHRLRTPITALRLDADGLRDEEERARLGSDVDELRRQVDALITEARRPVREGVLARCDATAAVTDRVAFWAALAEEQHRAVGLDVPAQEVPVRASAADLEAALDALLGNVMAHTPDGAGFAVRLTVLEGGGGLVVVSDEGPGFADQDVVRRGESRAGSTGLGLDIARRTAVASGGDVELGRGPSGGAQVRMRLGPPTD